VMGGAGRTMVQRYLAETVAYYAAATQADNHAVREAACACIAELGNRRVIEVCGYLKIWVTLGNCVYPSGRVGLTCLWLYSGGFLSYVGSGGLPTTWKESGFRYMTLKTIPKLKNVQYNILDYIP
jgi:hypothetical protein